MTELNDAQTALDSILRQCYYIDLSINGPFLVSGGVNGSTKERLEAIKKHCDVIIDFVESKKEA